MDEQHLSSCGELGEESIELRPTVGHSGRRDAGSREPTQTVGRRKGAEPPLPGGHDPTRAGMPGGQHGLPLPRGKSIDAEGRLEGDDGDGGAIVIHELEATLEGMFPEVDLELAFATERKN